MGSRKFALCFLIVILLGETFGSLRAKEAQKKTIIALAPHIVELLYDIGAGQQIIATSTFADYPEAAKSLLIVGDHNRLQIEKIVQLNPDLIIAWRGGNPTGDLARLENYGLKVVFSEPKTLEDIADEIQWFGELTGRKQQADLKAQGFRNRLSSLASTYKNKAPVSVFYEIWSSPLQTISANAWPQKHLDLCGASNIFSIENNDYPSVSSEQVLTLKPQVIIQPSAKTSNNSTLYDWSKYGFLPAVKNEFIYHPNADKVFRMTTRVLDEVELMCTEIERARHYYQTR